MSPRRTYRFVCRHCHLAAEQATEHQPSHLCDRTGRHEMYLPVWSPEIAVERELPVVRRLKVAA
jgi:hypothetical protein